VGTFYVVKRWLEEVIKMKIDFKYTVYFMTFCILAFLSFNAHAAGNLGGASGSAGGADNALTAAQNVTMSSSLEQTPSASGLADFTAAPNDYMLDMLGGIIGGQAMSYVFANNTNASGAKLFTGYTVKKGTPDITVFTYVLGLLLQGILVCSAVLISWSYLLTSSGTAQDGSFLGKNRDSSFLPFRTGLSVVTVAPIPAFGGLSLAQYIVVCAMCLGVIVAGNISAGLVNFTIDQSVAEMSGGLHPKDVAPLVRKMAEMEATCLYLKEQKGNAKFNDSLLDYKFSTDEQNPFFGSSSATTMIQYCEQDLSSVISMFPVMKILTYFEKTHLFELESSYVSPSKEQKVSGDYGGSTVDSLVSTMKRAGEGLAKDTSMHSADLIKMVAENSDFVAFMKKAKAHARAYVDAGQGVEFNAASSLFDYKEDVKLFDSAVAAITQEFNKTYLSAYAEPAHMEAYATRLKETFNSQGFATLGGTVFSLLSISDAAKNSAKSGVPATTYQFNPADYDIKSTDGAKGDALVKYNAYQAEIGGLFKYSKYKMNRPINSAASLKLQAEGLQGDQLAATLVSGMGLDTININSGSPAMFEMRGLGNNALGLATTLATARLLAESAQDSIAGKAAELVGGSMVLKGVVQVLNMVIPYMFILGGVLAFVLPALPWFFWVTAIVGLIIFFAEAMIAINIWALALAHPDGEGPTSSASSQGLQLLIRLTFQPSIMVAAFAFAMVAVDVVARFVTTFTFDALAGSMTSLFSFVGIMTLYVAILLSVTWTIYGVLSQMSSQVFGWIGQASHDIGEAKGEQNFVAAMNSTKQVGHAAGRAGAGSDNKDKKGGGNNDE